MLKYNTVCSHAPLLSIISIGFHVEQGRILQNYAEDLIASGPKALRHRGQVNKHAREEMCLIV